MFQDFSDKQILMDSKLNNKGQSTVEFILSFVFAIGFIMFFIKLSIMYTNGYLVHYATYMSSRAYMVHDRDADDPSGGESEALLKAREVFETFGLQNFIPGFTNKIDASHPSSGGNSLDRNILVGVYTNFSQFIPYPLLSAGKFEVKLKSESFLGREVTRGECVKRTCASLKNNGSDSQCRIFTTVVDNGC